MVFQYIRNALQVLTFVTRVNPFGQQETAELVFGMYSVLDLHQVRCHAKRIVLQIALARLTPAGNKTRSKRES